MITLNLFDDNFSKAQICSVANQVPLTCRYVHRQMTFDGITLFTDGNMFGGLPELVQSTHKVGWLHEGYELHPENYSRITSVEDLFDIILTTEEGLVAYDPNVYKRIIRGGTWVRPQNWAIYPKDKLVSMILSEKNTLPGHLLRHEIATAVPGIDLFGYGYRPTGPEKAWVYRDYMFAVVIEASKRPNWFSEHLLDCIAYGTIPIYWGCPNIKKYLDDFGLLYVHNAEQLADLLPKLTPNLYRAMLPAVYTNLMRLPEYAVTEDWFVRNVLVPEFGL